MVSQLLLGCSGFLLVRQREYLEVLGEIHWGDLIVAGLHIFYCDLTGLLPCSTILFQFCHLAADGVQIALERLYWVLDSGWGALHAVELLQAFADVVKERLF